MNKDEQLIENVERLLSEVTEDEIEHIADVLSELNPKDMAFDRLFDGKYRIVIDFPTLDTSTELGQFVDLWKNMGYTADWSKGTVSGERVLRDASPSGFADQILSMSRGTEKEQFKKINMKIGKWLSKMLGYQTKYQALRKKVADFFAPAGYEARGGFTGKQIIKALGGEDSEDFKNYYRLESYIYMMARPDEEAQVGFPPQLASVPPIEKLIKYWTHNAAFIKKNIVKAESESGKYSIIITRHPMDVLRMADFENIESCHSPPSRGGSGQYYKCAVAEAHGHGAVAYVVKTEDLLHATNTSNIDSAEQEIQDGEIFGDTARMGGAGFDIMPVSRTRLRQVKYYDKQRSGGDVATYAEKNPLEGVELAIPESRRYGAQIPGFVERVRQWSRESQKEQMEDAPTMSHVRTAEGPLKGIDLDQFIKFGGSHEDNKIDTLIELLWANKDMTYYGTVDQDTNTEDSLDANLMGSLIDQYQDETNDIADTFNTRMRYCEIGGTALDDDGDGVYITLEGTMTLKWPKIEWKSLPNKSRVEWIDDELNEFGMSWAELSDIGVENNNVVMTFKILPQKLQGYGGEEYAWGPDRFQDFGGAVAEECDDRHAAVKQIVDYFCKREGWMEGGAIMVLGSEVEGGEFDFSEWSSEAEEGYEYGEMESVRFTADISIAYADINDALADPAENFRGVNEETAAQIAESRQFRIALRTAMVTPAQEEVNKTYYPPIETSVQSVSPTEVYIRIEYYATGDDPDGLVEVLKALVEHWDEEYEIHEVVKKTFIWAARQAKVANQAAPGELSLEEQKLFEVEDMLRIR